MMGYWMGEGKKNREHPHAPRLLNEYGARMMNRTNGSTIMNAISANELKTKGIGCVEARLEEEGAAAITVRGKARYVILSSEVYGRLREAELAYAVKEVKEDLKQGRIAAKSLTEHLKQVKPCRSR